MVGPPSYPDTGEGSGPPGSGRRTGRQGWKTAAIVIVVIALLVMMVILHLTGTLGTYSHG
jgi:hypothetical protein